MVATFGQGAQLAKVNVTSAYWIVPVNPVGGHLLVGHVMERTNLCEHSAIIRVQISVKDFTALLDAATRGLRSLGVRYADHSPGSSVCEENCVLMSATFDWLGCPLAQDKTEGLTTCLEYLGIEIDTVALEMCLLPHKLERLQTTLQEGQKCSMKRDLQSPSHLYR